MCEVLDKITIKFEILHQLSVVKHGMFRKIACGGCSVYSMQVEFITLLTRRFISRGLFLRHTLFYFYVYIQLFHLLFALSTIAHHYSKWLAFRWLQLVL